MTTKLDGCWRRVRSEDTNSSGEDIIVEFRSDGSLIYNVVEQTGLKKIFLRYYVDGDEIVTDQPSAPRIERTRFKREGRKMILEKGGRSEIFEEIEREKAEKMIGQLSRFN